MNPQDILVFFNVHLDQAKALLVDDDQCREQADSMAHCYAVLRRTLVEDNGIATEIADAFICAMVASFAGYAKLTDDVED